MKLLDRGHSFKLDMFHNPSQIDKSKELVKLISEETKAIEMLWLLEMRLSSIKSRINRLQENDCDYIFKF